jgi:hypothetical protein
MPNLFEVMRKAGKRGKNATLYPCDFVAVKVILETFHDVTGKHFQIEVIGSNVSEAMAKLGNLIREEDYLIDQKAA